MTRAELEAREAAQNRRHEPSRKSKPTHPARDKQSMPPQQRTRASKPQTGGNPMNALVPYLDLFGRLNNEELERLAGVDAAHVLGMRQRVDQVNQSLASYADLLPRLTDDELVRLTGQDAKTIRFWRLCQPRSTSTAAAPDKKSADQPAARKESATPQRDEISLSAIESGAEGGGGLGGISGEPFPGYEGGHGGSMPMLSGDDIGGGAGEAPLELDLLDK